MTRTPEDALYYEDPIIPERVSLATLVAPSVLIGHLAVSTEGKTRWHDQPIDGFQLLQCSHHSGRFPGCSRSTLQYLSA